MLKCSNEPIYRNLRKYGIPVRKTNELSDKIVINKGILKNLYIDNQMSVRDISLIFECRPYTIEHFLYVYDIKKRSLKEACNTINVFEKHSKSSTGDNNPAKRPDVRDKISKSRIGRFTGSNSPLFGREVPEITRKRISDSHLGRFIGPDNPNWRGGKSQSLYCHKFNNRFKSFIRKKFNNLCFICHERETLINKLGIGTYELCVHHIDYNRNSICNGKSWAFVPLCRKCHAKTNFNKWMWFNLLINYWLFIDEIQVMGGIIL
jgi:hypothetical protein